jgi:hypothetical protein
MKAPPKLTTEARRESRYLPGKASEGTKVLRREGAPSFRVEAQSDYFNEVLDTALGPGCEDVFRRTEETV